MAVVAKRYAKALVDVAFKVGDYAKIEQELILFEGLLTGHRELYLFYTNPAIPTTKKRAATAELLEGLGLTRTTANFISVLIDRHRIGYFSEIRQAYQQGVNERLGVVEAHVTTAAEMDGETQNRLQTALQDLTGKKVVLRFGMDPALIGGAITRIGDTIYDGSVREQLALIKARLSSD